MARRAKGIKWDLELRLGKMMDKTLAEALEVTEGSVRYARKQRGIPAYAPPVVVPPVRDVKPEINWADLPLGKVTDREISLLVGVANGTVAAHRTRLGILPRYATKRSNPLHSAA